MRIITIVLTGLSLSLPSEARAQRLEAGAFLTYASLEQIGSSDHRAGTSTAGLGGRVVWHFGPFVDLDGELAVHPNAGVQGYKLEGFVGAKVGVRTRWFGGFVKVRPGFLYFSKDPFGVSRPGAIFARASSLDRALDIGGVIEYYTPGRLIVRFDLGETVVTYRPRVRIFSQFQPPEQVGGFTTRNPQWSIGLGKRF